MLTHGGSISRRRHVASAQGRDQPGLDVKLGQSAVDRAVDDPWRVTPAMASGPTDRLWDINDLVAVIDAEEEAPKKRGPYKEAAR